MYETNQTKMEQIKKALDMLNTNQPMNTPMPNLNLNLTPDQATALYLALDNTIYFGTDFKDRFTKQQREDVLDIFKQARPYNPQWRKNNG